MYGPVDPEQEIHLPRLREFEGDTSEWSFAAYLNYSQALERFAKNNDQARRKSALQTLRADLNEALKAGLEDHGIVVLLAQNTTDLEERLRLYTIAAKLCSANLPDDHDFIVEAEATFEAGQLLREVGLLQEKKGNFPEAEKCFTRALVYLQDATDLFETHCLSELDVPEEETFPLRPRLLAELKRVKKHPKT